MRRARLIADITKSELSVAVGIGRMTLAKIENGECDPRISTIERIAQATGVDVFWLIAGDNTTVKFAKSE